MKKNDRLRLTESEETTLEGVHEAPSSISGDLPAVESSPASASAPGASQEATGPVEAASELESGAFVEEVAIQLTGRMAEVVVIREGWSLNDRYYTRAGMEQSVPLWEGADICEYGWSPNGLEAGHVPPRVELGLPEGTFINKVGHLRNVRGRISKADGRYELIAEAHFVDAKFRDKLREIQKSGGRLPGLSIHAYGDFEIGVAEGRRGPIVHALTDTKELTVVSKPAAGGAIVRLVAAETPQTHKETDMKWKKLRDFLAGKFPPASTSLVEAMEEKVLLESVAQTLKESDNKALAAFIQTALEFIAEGLFDQAGRLLEKALEHIGAEPEAEVAPDEEPPAPVDAVPADLFESARAESEKVLAEAKRVQEETLAAIKTAQCDALLNRRLEESKLPEVAENKIRAKFAGKVFSEAELESDIKDIKDILAVNAGGQALIESAHERSVRGTVLTESIDKLAMGADLLFGYDWRNDASLTEAQKEVYRSLGSSPRNFAPSALYYAATGDYDRSNQIRQGSLLEAASNASFTNILGTSMNRTLAFVFSSTPEPVWDPIVKQIDVFNLKQQDRIVAGGFSTLPKVNELGTYQDLGVPLELPVNYSLSKFGGLFSFSEEAIFNDDLNYFASLIPSMKDAALDTRDRDVWRALIGNLGGGNINSDTSYDSTTIYNAAHDNLGSTALGADSLKAAYQSIMRTRKISFRTKTTASALIGATTLTVASTSGMQAGNYIKIATEILRITSVDSSTGITVTRAQLGTVADAVADQAAVLVLGGSLNVGLGDLYLIVPIGLYNTALELVESDLVPGSTATNNKNTLKGLMQVIALDEQYLGGDMNNWYVSVGYRAIAGLELAYFQGKRAPEIIVQDQPAQGTVFTNDQLNYKIKFRYGVKSILHEGRYGAIVS